MQLFEYIGLKFAIFDVYIRVSGIKAGRKSPVLIPLYLVLSFGVVWCNFSSHALSAGADLVETTQRNPVLEIRYAFNGPFIKIAEDLISACREHVVAATGPSPFKVRDNQRPERTRAGAAKTSA